MVVKRLVVLSVLAGFVIAAAPAAAASGPYRTDRQAARYVQSVRGGYAYCLNGYYSRHEQRTHRHFPQRFRARFRSFACSWTRRLRSERLYVVTRPGRWLIVRDR